MFYSIRWHGGGNIGLVQLDMPCLDKPEGPFVPKGYVLTSKEMGLENSI